MGLLEIKNQMTYCRCQWGWLIQIFFVINTNDDLLLSLNFFRLWISFILELYHFYCGAGPLMEKNDIDIFLQLLLSKT